MMEVRPSLKEQIRKAQADNKDTTKIKKDMKKGKSPGFTKDQIGTLWFGKHIYMCHITWTLRH